MYRRRIGFVAIQRHVSAPAIVTATLLLGSCTVDDGVDTNRSDRTPATATPTITTPTITTPTITGPDEPPPSTSSSSASSPVSLDDVVVLPTSDISIAFVPENPDLLGPATDLADGRDSTTLLAQEMVFAGMAMPVIVDGAPVTRRSIEVRTPTFGDSGATTAPVMATNYRFALEIDSDNIDIFGEAVLDELEPAIAAANPDEIISRDTSEGVLRQPVFELIVGPPVDPRMIVEVTQHYFIVPRLVEDPLLSVDVTRFVDGPDPDELPTRDEFIDDGLAEQIGLLDGLADGGEPTITYASVGVTIPTAGEPVARRTIEYDYPIPTDGYEPFSDALKDAVEAGGYQRRSGGDPREFFSDDAVERDEFQLSEREQGIALVRVDGGLIPYPG